MWSVSGAERAAGSAGRLAAIVGFSSRGRRVFAIPQSTRWQAAEAARFASFAASVPWRSHVDSRALRADSGPDFFAKNFPQRTKKHRLPIVTPHALSNPGAHSESFVIKTAPTECMRCDKPMTTKKDKEMKNFREILRKKGKKKCTADKSAVHSKC